MYIELKNVTKKIRGVTVLDNVSLRMESGNIYGFKGKNGSGKTMLMRAVAGLIRVDGIVDINGKIMGKDMMFPDSIGIDDERIRETLSEVGLEPYDKRTFRKYSLGMKQRLGIAAAIMENPDIIILDEPINALDDSGTEQVSKLLMKHKERGALIIIACHDAEELDYLSDDIIEIAEGRIKNNKADKGGTN